MHGKIIADLLSDTHANNKRDNSGNHSLSIVDYWLYGSVNFNRRKLLTELLT